MESVNPNHERFRSAPTCNLTLYIMGTFLYHSHSPFSLPKAIFNFSVFVIFHKLKQTFKHAVPLLRASAMEVTHQHSLCPSLNICQGIQNPPGHNQLWCRLHELICLHAQGCNCDKLSCLRWHHQDDDFEQFLFSHLLALQLNFSSTGFTYSYDMQAQDETWGTLGPSHCPSAMSLGAMATRTYIHTTRQPHHVVQQSHWEMAAGHGKQWMCTPWCGQWNTTKCTTIETVTHSALSGAIRSDQEWSEHYQDAIRSLEKSILNFSSTTNSRTNPPLISLCDEKFSILCHREFVVVCVLWLHHRQWHQ